MNQATIIGNLGKDPEMSYTPSGLAVCKFSVATSYKSAKGEETTWHNVVAFDKQAEVLNQYLHRGNKVAIVGRIQNRTYDKQDGTKGYASEIIVSSFEFLSPKAKEDEAPAAEETF